MNALTHIARIAAFVIFSFIGGFFLSHFVSDVVLDHNAIGWLWSTVHWIRDCFFPAIREPDDLEGMYLMLLFLICWIAMLAISLTLRVLFRRPKQASVIK